MDRKSFWFSSNGIAALLFIGAVTYFLLMEHRDHLFQALPFLIILLCPLMHLFMHGGHGHGGHRGARDSSRDDLESDDEIYRRGYEQGHKDAESNQRDA